MKPVIKIASAFFTGPLHAATFDFYCAQLPEQEQQKLRRFRRWEDATASLIGKILLRKLLDTVGLNNFKLADIKYTDEGRPFLNNVIDFNITHADNCVACALALGGKVGIDVEKIREIKLSDFEGVFTKSELQQINNAANRNKTFYEIWTRKEAIVKADGCGLGVELTEIDTTVRPIKLNGEIWQLKDITMENDFVMSLAYNNSGYEIEFINVAL